MNLVERLTRYGMAERGRRPVDETTLLWWFAQANRIADWLIERGLGPELVV